LVYLGPTYSPQLSTQLYDFITILYEKQEKRKKLNPSNTSLTMKTNLLCFFSVSILYHLGRAFIGVHLAGLRIFDIS